MTDKPAMPERLKAEVEQLTEAIFEMVEKFKKLHNPLFDSQEKVPRATEQLDKISQQTEAAAHRMLDVVEQITEREAEVTEGLAELKTKLGKKSVHEFDKQLDAMIEKSTTTCNDAYAIMYVVQFQDITAQQMNHAAALLEDIEGKLQEVREVMRGDAKKTVASHKERAFDPHADMTDKKAKQEDIDNLFSQK